MTEPGLMLLAMLFMAIRKHPWQIICLSLGYVITLFAFRDVHIHPDMLLAHPLAGAHILTSWAAKTLMMGLCFVSVWAPERITKNAIYSAFVVHGLSIILGMFWAFDASNWGALWQWDGIETLSLCSLCAVYGWSKSPKSALFSFATLAILLLQNISLYGIGMSEQISRHGYTELSSMHIHWIFSQIAIGIICAAVMLYHHRTSPHHTSVKFIEITSNFAIFLTLFIAISICLNQDIQHEILWCAFLVIFVLMNLKLGIHAIFPCCLAASIFILPAILPTHADMALASLDAKDDQPRLTGLHAEPQEDALRYDFSVQMRDKQLQLSMISDNTGNYPIAHDDITGIQQSLRIRAVQYRAVKGVDLLVQDITWHRYTELWLILIFLASLSGFITRKKPENGIKNGEQEHGEHIHEA